APVDRPSECRGVLRLPAAEQQSLRDEALWNRGHDPREPSAWRRVRSSSPFPRSVRGWPPPAGRCTAPLDPGGPLRRGWRPKMSDRPQLELFAPAPGVATEPQRPPEPPAPAPATEALRDLGRRLPVEVRLGTSSWSFPGWTGLVYAREATPELLAREGLPAY